MNCKIKTRKYGTFELVHLNETSSTEPGLRFCAMEVL